MRRGARLELQLDVWHRRYREDGAATVVKCHPGVRVDKNGKLFFSSVGPPDYMGALATGRGICFEAKESAKPSLPLSCLPLHQAQLLEAFHLAGWISGIVGMLPAGYFWFNWADNRERYWSGKRGSFQPTVKLGPDGWINATEVVGER